jgi:hypothetical protein
VTDPVEEAAGRLYGLPLEDFTRERDATARALRKEKERDAAAVVAKLPKPSQASWAANQLARERRDLVDELLSAGAALREAQEGALAGQGSKPLRDAAAAERAAVDALVDAARELRPAGRRATETTLDRLRNSLHVAAADDEVRAALDAGRLVEDAEGGLAWGVFAGVDTAAAGEAEPATRRAAKRGAEKAAPTTRRRTRAPARDDEATKPEREAAEKERKAREAAEREERERRRQIQADLREARAELRARERELGRVEREAERAARRLEDALAAAEDARSAAEEARAEADSARDAASSARDDVARLEEQLD